MPFRRFQLSRNAAPSRGKIDAAIVMELFDAMKISRLTLLHGGKNSVSQWTERRGKAERSLCTYAPIWRTARLGIPSGSNVFAGSATWPRLTPSVSLTATMSSAPTPFELIAAQS